MTTCPICGGPDDHDHPLELEQVEPYDPEDPEA